MILCFVLGQRQVLLLSERAANKIHSALKPATAKCYRVLFRTFVAYFIVVKLCLEDLNMSSILLFLEYLLDHRYSVHMIPNYLSAIKTKFVMYNLNYRIIEDPKIKYLLNPSESLGLYPFLHATSRTFLL